MAGTDRHPLAAEERVQSPLLDDDGHFRVRIDTSRYPGIRGDGHLFNVQRLAPVMLAYQDAGLQPGAAPAVLRKSCLSMIGTSPPLAESF